jgi:hypothetical protein
MVLHKSKKTGKNNEGKNNLKKRIDQKMPST